MPPARTDTAGLQEDMHKESSSRLVLCFDGTGNKFQGTPGDTNIVKLYNMLDRGHKAQLHYYQPGIGTYPAEGPVNVSWFKAFLRKIGASLDEGLATSFDSHVIAGYRFIMRYYKPGDKIYIFGFSRGAFTARFLARMISHVGLLSKGNEELVPFAYKVYQEYEQNRGGTAEKQAKQVIYMNSFKQHFCRTERKKALENNADLSANESGIKVHFLGLFDCVSSVGNLDVPFFAKTPPLPAVHGTAEHVRHAVAIDERRVKFKAALFSQEQDNTTEDIKEVWFPGNHGDIGGGWAVAAKESGDARKTTDNDYFQLSDIALKWMMDEIDDVESNYEPAKERFAWDAADKADFLLRFEKHKPEMVSARMHDTLTFGGGAKWGKVLMWKFIEYLPVLVKRWEYVEDGKNKGTYIWDYIRFPLNMGGRRDIPANALFHHSVLDRMRLEPDSKNYRPKLYTPNNSLWVPSENATDKTKSIARNLSDLCKENGPKNGQSNGTGQSNGAAAIHFVHAEELTTGSIAIKNVDVSELNVTVKDGDIKDLAGAKKWDRVYRVALGA